jgi:stage II sporulation protein E
MTGEVVFFKSGAAASYVKRDSSIFRIRSETAPIGLMKNVDAERVRVEARDGDVIVMISDGVSQSPEDAVWLIEYLNKNKADNLADYADKILTLAVKNSAAQDDMSVIAVRIKKI